ncbi:MAG: sulfotransferase [Cyanobacteria bacterium P01_C01_bin.70]
MSAWLGAALLAAIFIFLVQALGLVKRGENVVFIAIESLDIISSPRLSDEEKESKLQHNSKQLFGLFLLLAGGGAIALLVPIGILWLCEQAGWLSLKAVSDRAVSPLFIAASTLLFLLALYLKSRFISSSKSEKNSYSKLDQTLHKIAFKTYDAQTALAGFENQRFSERLTHFKTARPVFITALPRAGTTLLLECFARSPEFASHCYRDMPFVLIPCLWNSYSKIFQRDVKAQERAHGDGMKISPDSPEALEEILWETFWPRHYQTDRIIPWSHERNEEFAKFFRSHMRKISLLRCVSSPDSTRYVSKNNANIARIRLLGALFPDAAIIIPFRHPLNHSASLLQQHLNFLSIHKTDSFALEYMQAIGHHDFGQNLCPIDFDGWLDRRQSQSAESIVFWLEYWIASYAHFLKEKSDFLSFLNYDSLCKNPEAGLKAAADAVRASDTKALVENARHIGRPRPKQIDTSAFSKSLLQKASRIYDDLKELSING